MILQTSGTKTVATPARVHALVLLFFLAPGICAAEANEVQLAARPSDSAPAPALELNREYWKGYLSDTKSIATAPFRWDGQDWRTASAVLAVTAGLYLYDQEIQDWAQRNRSRTSNRIAHMFKPFGDGRVTVPALAVLYLYGDSSGDARATRTALLGVESFVVANVFTMTIKYAGRRPRPFTGEPAHRWDVPGVSGSGNSLSFPSGHATSAFAVATVVASEYKDTAGVPTIAYSVATLTALSRINANEHWASDVFFGSALGYFTARAIVERHGNATVRNFTVLPFSENGYAGLSASCSF